MKTNTKNNVALLFVGFLSIGLFLSVDKAIAKQQKEYALGAIPLSKEVYDKHIKKQGDFAVTAEVLPSSYDARSYGLVTRAKDQGSCGSYWAFSSVGALESHLLKAGLTAEQKDLSEQQQVSCNTEQSGCDGGNAEAINYWDKDGFWESNGPLNESYFPYTGSDGTSCDEDQQLNYRVTNWHTVSVDNNSFKSSLYNDGPSWFSFSVYDDFFTYWNTGASGSVYTNVSSSQYKGGHAVLLIGWNDSKSAYLCKNSWGATGGPNGDGTFWIAYAGHAHDLGFQVVNFSVTTKDSSAYATLFAVPSDLEMMRQYRDNILSKTSKGSLYVEELYKHSEEALKVLNDNPELMSRAGELLQAKKNAAADVLAQGNGTIHNTDAITDFLADYAKASPPDLRFLVNKVRVDMKKHKQEKKQFFGFTLE